MGDWFERLVRAAARRPGRVLAVAGVLAIAGASLALLKLEPSASTDTLVGSGSEAFQATETYRERFGDHSIVILVSGDGAQSLPDIVLTKNLGRLLGLEGCISGNRPGARDVPGGAGSPCDRLARTKPVQVVYGPGTFINSAVTEIQEQLRTRYQAALAEGERAAEAARRVARSQGKPAAEVRRLGESAKQISQASFLRDLLQYNVKYGLDIKATPYLNNPDFVAPLVFDASQGAATPKARFAYLFPNDRSAAIQVRLKPDLSEAERAEAIRDVRAAVAMPLWQLEAGATYTVTGAPVVVEELTNALSDSILRLLAIALVVMAVALAIVFRSRLRLVPLGVALGATAVLFGLMALLGLELTMASIAVLPVLLGLGVDYAIQYQARVEESEADAEPGAAALAATRLAVPTIATAMVATAVGFALLLLSPVPMVRGFGVLLIAGVVLAFFFALTAGTALLVLTGRRRASESRFAAAARGAADLVDATAGRVAALRPRRRGTPLRERVLRAGLARPGRVLLIGLALACVGWVVDSQTDVESDIAELVPQDLQALRDLRTLQEVTGVSGEVDVVIEGEDLTRPEVFSWMREYQSGLLEDFDYSRENGCGQAELCPALSLPDLFRTEAATSSQERIDALLEAVPPYFSQAVITADRRTANLAFGIKLMPLDRQKEVVDAMRERLDPPEGVTARVAGLPVLAADANATLASPWRRLGTLAAGLLAVFLVLAFVRRRSRTAGLPAWVPVVPIALATGWSALVLFVLRVPLNPMSATLGALVIAISTEFAVLLSARYRQERAAGHAVEAALRRTYRSTGAAVLASGVTAIAGFAVLALSDIAMLRDFGIVTVVDLSVSLLGVLAVLPAVLVLAERRAAPGGGAPPAVAEREPVAA